MLSSLRQCAMTLTRIHTSKVKVTPHIKRSEYTCLCIDLTYTTHNLKKYPSITCSYIQEYLGYRSNNLYFLFSHSLPVVVYNFGKVQRTSQVERKTKCSKKTTVVDIAVLWTALFILHNTFSGTFLLRIFKDKSGKISNISKSSPNLCVMDYSLGKIKSVKND